MSKSITIRLHDSSTIHVLVDYEIVAIYSYDEVGMERAKKLVQQLKSAK